MSEYVADTDKKWDKSILVVYCFMSSNVMSVE